MEKTLSEKIAFLQGLADGLEIEDGSKQGKIIAGILGVLEDMAAAIEEDEQDLDDLKDYVECIDDDLAEVEDIIDDEEIDDDDEMIEIVCPHCDEVVYLDPECLTSEEEPLCPNCGQPILEEDDEDED